MFINTMVFILLKLELNRLFTKDADKLPANIQRQMALIITNLQQAKQLNQINDCR